MTGLALAAFLAISPIAWDEVTCLHDGACEDLCSIPLPTDYDGDGSEEHIEEYIVKVCTRPGESTCLVDFLTFSVPGTRGCRPVRGFEDGATCKPKFHVNPLAVQGHPDLRYYVYAVASHGPASCTWSSGLDTEGVLDVKCYEQPPGEMRVREVDCDPPEEPMR